MKKKLPEAVWSGSFKVFGVDMKCHVLDNGDRIIEGECMRQLFGEDSGFSQRDTDEGELEDFVKWQRGQGREWVN